MTGSPTFQRLTRESLEQHEQIHFYLDRLSGALRSLQEGPPEIEGLRRLGAQIEGLQERLREHQESEEGGGLLRRMREALPDAAEQIARLQAEHTRMIEVLEMARIHAQRGGEGDLPYLARDLDEFLETIRKHESDEEDLLRRAIAAEADSSETRG